MNVISEKKLSMPGEARKLQLIQDILKIDEDIILTTLETTAREYLRAKSRPKPNWDALFGCMTKEEADAFEKAINDNFRKINPDDWRQDIG